MAMDKEKLLAHFQTHYLSRQEVLFHRSVLAGTAEPPQGKSRDPAPL